jgi:hypothetical protein
MSRKKKWTIERFTADVMPLAENAFGERCKLSLRESVILTSAMIDTALAELISKRLIGPEHEIVEFLGADADGRAPCGSFGSRIQLARLLGILVEEDVALLRLVKKLRNMAAHRVKLEIGAPEVADLLVAIFEFMKTPVTKWYSLLKMLRQRDPRIMKRLAKEDPEGEKIHEAMKRLDEIAPEYDDMHTASRAWLKTKGVENANGADLLTVAFIFFPKLLRTAPTAAPMMLATLLSVYNSRFQLLMNSIAPISQVELPRDAIKLWPSDRIQNSGNETGDGASGF